MGCNRPGKLLQDPSGTAIQLHHSSCPQDGRHSHIRGASFLLKFSTKLQMSPWSREREDQRSSEMSICPSLNTRLQSLGEALRKLLMRCTCPSVWVPHSFHTTWPLSPYPGLFMKWLSSPCPPCPLSIHPLGLQLHKVMFISDKLWTKRYLWCLNGPHQANSTLSKHLLRPSYAANTVCNC